MSIKTKVWKLPVDYTKLDRRQRRRVRLQYIKEQQNLCQYCEMPLNEAPDLHVGASDIHWDLFPDGFREHPVHLHHSHKTGMTIGAVHMRCNAYLWIYKGE